MMQYEDIDPRYADIKKAANEDDRKLALLLMCAAFYNDGAIEAERRLGPLYLIQAVYLNREMKPELKALL